MSDERLRRVERGAAAGRAGDPERLLRERVRAGLRPPEALDLLAYLDAPVETRADADALREWVWNLLPLGAPRVVQAVALAARRVVEEADLFEPPEPEEAVSAAEAWWACPCAPCAARARGAAEAVPAVASRLALADQGAAIAAYAAHHAAQAAWVAQTAPGVKPFLLQAGLTLRTVESTGLSPDETLADVRDGLRRWLLT